MSHHAHFEHSPWQLPVLLTLTLLLAASLYLRGWIHLRSASASAIPAWRAGSFFLGLFFVWTAAGSPLAAYDHNLLTAHMIKHLFLMTFAPALILMGEPLRALFCETSHLPQNTYARAFSSPLVHWFGGLLTRPALCWTVSALTSLCGISPHCLPLASARRTMEPVAGALLTIVELWEAFFGSGDPLIHVVLAGLGVVLMLVGPGAWSIDARLFGRKRIKITDDVG